MQSCESNVDVPVIPEQKQFANVDERLWEYFEAFEDAAAEKGIDYDISALNLIGSIEDIHDEGVAGTCSYGFRGPRDVVVDLPFWNSSSYFNVSEPPPTPPDFQATDRHSFRF